MPDPLAKCSARFVNDVVKEDRACNLWTTQYTLPLVPEELQQVDMDSGATAECLTMPEYRLSSEKHRPIVTAGEESRVHARLKLCRH